jgi:hypothetical protein
MPLVIFALLFAAIVVMAAVAHTNRARNVADRRDTNRLGATSRGASPNVPTAGAFPAVPDGVPSGLFMPPELSKPLWPLLTERSRLVEGPATLSAGARVDELDAEIRETLRVWESERTQGSVARVQPVNRLEAELASLETAVGELLDITGRPEPPGGTADLKRRESDVLAKIAAVADARRNAPVSADAARRLSAIETHIATALARREQRPDVVTVTMDNIDIAGIQRRAEEGRAAMLARRELWRTAPPELEREPEHGGRPMSWWVAQLERPRMDLWERQSVMIALGEIGPAANAALPRLWELTRHRSSDIRDVAARAIILISVDDDEIQRAHDVSERQR